MTSPMPHASAGGGLGRAFRYLYRVPLLLLHIFVLLPLVLLGMVPLWAGIRVGGERLEHFGVSDRIREFDVSSATVELAAVAVGVEPARIAKTLSFKLGEDPILVVTAGDAKIDNSKYKHFFGMKAKMLTPEEAVERIGHAVGGVCPFALPEDVKTYLDLSLRRFDTVFPAVGSAASAIELTCGELERCCGTNFVSWVDVCKGWQEETDG